MEDCLESYCASAQLLLFVEIDCLADCSEYVKMFEAQVLEPRSRWRSA